MNQSQLKAVQPQLTHLRWIHWPLKSLLAVAAICLCSCQRDEAAEPTSSDVADSLPKGGVVIESRPIVPEPIPPASLPDLPVSPKPVLSKDVIPKDSNAGSIGEQITAGSEIVLPGDLLQVEVEGQPKYSGQVRVSALGAPFFNLGVVPAVAGMGTAQLANELMRRYRERDLRDPHLTVSIREYAPRRIYLMGSVLRPGAIPLNPAGATTLLRAIAEAGGFTEDANRQAIRLLRDGKLALVFNEVEILRDPTRDTVLKPDDQLIISPLDRIYVSGEVTRSGPLVPPSGETLTVSRAISMAGGLSRYASRSIQVLRGSDTITVDLDAVISGSATDMGLQPGDTIFVPQRRF